MKLIKNLSFVLLISKSLQYDNVVNSLLITIIIVFIRITMRSLG